MDYHNIALTEKTKEDVTEPPAALASSMHSRFSSHESRRAITYMAKKLYKKKNYYYRLQ